MTNDLVTQRYQITYVNEIGELVHEDYDATQADILAEAHKVIIRERRPVTIWTRAIYATIVMKPVVELVTALDVSKEVP